ncbi:hypothetical protein SAMN05216582_11283 [Selenomonas ruminantium]|uniref:Multidrug transporter n=1 Tax=Selenomonas ruminantium TaxID=971 RepID=A0A1M6UI15_SELRU|nr:multidrug transporter [Selenomonas ruminantium]SHK68862.1 hypothetical protein SAMN05216582_11283 [Selenomonas ruminantium]
MPEKIITEKDWKLFRKMLPTWQERYMETLINDYEAILVSAADAFDKFWKLEKRIRNDKKKSGVCVTEMSRSQMFANIMVLLDEKVITLDDLEGFSDSLRERIEFLHR